MLRVDADCGTGSPPVSRSSTGQPAAADISHAASKPGKRFKRRGMTNAWSVGCQNSKPNSESPVHTWANRSCSASRPASMVREVGWDMDDSVRHEVFGGLDDLLAGKPAPTGDRVACENVFSR